MYFQKLRSASNGRAEVLVDSVPRQSSSEKPSEQRSVHSPEKPTLDQVEQELRSSRKLVDQLRRKLRKYVKLRQNGESTSSDQDTLTPVQQLKQENEELRAEIQQLKGMRNGGSDLQDVRVVGGNPDREASADPTVERLAKENEELRTELSESRDAAKHVKSLEDTNARLRKLLHDIFDRYNVLFSDFLPQS